MTSFDPLQLLTAYDRGRLVPFTGSGMSVPACTTWDQFVARLESGACIPAAAMSGSTSARLVERALVALRVQRRMGISLPDAVRKALYLSPSGSLPENAVALARLHWPLICTTNYDDIHLRATVHCLLGKGTAPDDLPDIRVLGRSDADCKRLLQHLALPAEQTIWALQGFLHPTHADARAVLDPAQAFDALEQELVVGHAEYRRVTHRAPHFRRAFAELFRSRSLLFLGSGLNEAYFRMLFDEIVELGGTPGQPHHAFVEEGALDPDFMQREYHIVCHIYPAGKHEHVGEWLRLLADALGRQRVRVSGWSFRMTAPSQAIDDRVDPEFIVVRGALPTPGELEQSAALAVSCGRDYPPGRPAEPGSWGYPGLSASRARELGLRDRDGRYTWNDENGFVVRFLDAARTYGIVARDFGDDDRATRSPEAIRKALIAFFEHARETGYTTLHIQVLAAGRHRAFASWVSLTQMARAFGEWCGKSPSDTARPRVIVHVVDSELLALLDGGFLDLREALVDAPLRLQIEVVEPGGERSRYHALVPATTTLGDVADVTATNFDPTVAALPKPVHRAVPLSLKRVAHLTLRDFGLVSGSTLVIDYGGEAEPKT